jgi:hypothetical protein
MFKNSLGDKVHDMIMMVRTITIIYTTIRINNNPQEHQYTYSTVNNVTGIVIVTTRRNSQA